MTAGIGNIYQDTDDDYCKVTEIYEDDEGEETVQYVYASTLKKLQKGTNLECDEMDWDSFYERIQDGRMRPVTIPINWKKRLKE